MKLLETRILTGCNVFYRASVILQDVATGPLAGLRTGTAGSDFAARFVDRFGELATLDPTGPLPPAFLRRLRSEDGAPFEEALLRAILSVEHSLALSLHLLQGVEFSRIQPGPSPERVTLVWRSRVPRISRLAGRAGMAGLLELLPDGLRPASAVEGRDFASRLRSARRSAVRRSLSPSTALLVDAAERRGISWTSTGGAYLRLGEGSRARRLWDSVTDATPFLACRLALDRRSTHHVLSERGLPVPPQREVASRRAALMAARSIGYPVVLKPPGGEKNGGITAGIRSEDEIPAAFERAAEHGASVLVEGHVAGDDHRLLVIDGRFVAAVQRLRATVTGDGRRTVRELIEDLNRDPYRDELCRCRVTLDAELHRLLARDGRGLDSVLPDGEVQPLRTTANVARGGGAVDVTDRVHPENRKMAARAVEAMGLDVGGVDFVTPDIRLSWRETGGIVEIDSRPELRPHTWPITGRPRDVAGAVLDALYPGAGDEGRVPSAVIVGRRRRSAVVRALVRLLRRTGRNVGTAHRREARVGRERITPEDVTNRGAVLAALGDPRVDSLVRTTSPSEVVRRGLRQEFCDAAAILDGLEADDAVPAALDVLARGVGTLVFAAEDTRVVEALGGIAPDRVILVSRARRAATERHLEAGGRAVLRTRNAGRDVIALVERKGTIASIPVAKLGIRSARPTRASVDPHLFALALAAGMNLPDRDLRKVLGLRGPSKRRPAPSDVPHMEVV